MCAILKLKTVLEHNLKFEQKIHGTLRKNSLNFGLSCIEQITLSSRTRNAGPARLQA